jgi:hypothetical protein
MSLTAEFRLSSPDLPFTDVARAVSGIQLRFLHWEGTSRGLAVAILEATGDALAALEDALEGAVSVENAALINDSGSARIYKLTPAGEIGANFDEINLAEGIPETVTVLPDGWRVRGLFPDRAALIALREFCVDSGISFQLEALYHSHEVTDESIGLTGAQVEALTTAYDMGSFEIPRRTTVAEIAAELGISSPALSERLRRAESHLVEQFVSIPRVGYAPRRE